MPGMENLAPERTLTRSGFSPLPSFWPCRLSSWASASCICRSTSCETELLRMYSRQASVWIVKPGGTGRPAFVISARPAPLPPRTSFIFPLPSALPPPKKYTYLVEVDLFWLELDSLTRVSGRVDVAMSVLYFYFGDSLPSVTISEKSAIVEHFLTLDCKRARRFARTFSSSTITIDRKSVV